MKIRLNSLLKSVYAQILYKLKGHTFQASIWVAGSNLLSQMLRFVSNLILTRLLAPDIFGLIATVNVLYIAMFMLSDFGIKVSVVQSKRGNEARFLGTTASIQIFQGVIIAIALICLSFLVDSLNSYEYFNNTTTYADPLLSQIIMIFAICAMFQGFESPKLALAQREMLAGAISRFELLSHVLMVLVTISLAWWLRTIWGVVLGVVIGSLIRTILSHSYLPGKLIRPCLDKVIIYEVLKFGKWIFLSSILGFLASNVEKILLAGVFDKSTFGIFSIAFTILSSLLTISQMINGRVIFPRLSQAFRQSNQLEINIIYIKIQKIIDIYLGVLAGILFILSDRLINFLYDDRYSDAGWMLQYLSLTLLAMRHQVFDQYMLARGEPQRMSMNNFFRLICLLIALPFGYYTGGNQGAIISVVISQFASWPLSLYSKYQHGLLNWNTEKLWLPSFVVGIISGLTIKSLF